ncbi:serine/threonine-protein kinase [Leptolyngbya sp. CCY15150]|uniref:serine/threonine protein kinase n=1 Tax=Leptolyngbya sp. CCY15150 TaxID=2767772 RepID=UPI001950FD48|nr:serine/threonine-protein kinase [Leptolyngbya sp. CCY15150]
MRDSLHSLGDRIADRYQLTRLLGQGGMGSTYAADDLATQQAVAIKVVSLQQSADWKTLELFEREAKVLQSIDHPQIPDYLDYFHLDTESDRRFYLVQELAPGVSLADWVARGWRTDEAGVKDMAKQLLDILNYLHWLTPPVVHRDLKPRNVLRCDDGRLYLVDFGAVQAVYGNKLTHGGTFVGTFGYMPPEQFRGKAYFASDLYALGATLMFVLTGRSPADLPQRRMKIDVRDCIQVSPDFTHWLEKILEPAVEDRFHSAQEALTALHLPAPKAIEAVSRTPRPVGSRMTIARQPDRLDIQIPPPRLKPAIAPVLVITGLLIAIAFSLGFYLGAILLLLLPLWILAAGPNSRRTLILTRETFTCEWQGFGFNGHYIGSCDRLIDDSASSHLSPLTSPLPAALLGTPFQQRLWLWGLTAAERQWLAAEVKEFVRELG